MMLNREERKFHIYETFKTLETFRVNELNDCHIKFDGNKHRIAAPDHIKTPTTWNYMENLYNQKSDFENIDASILSWTLKNMQSKTALLHCFWPFSKNWSMILGRSKKHVLNPTRSWWQSKCIPTSIFFQQLQYFFLAVSCCPHTFFVLSRLSLKGRNPPL